MNNERKIMPTEDYKRGVEDTLSILDEANVAKAYVRKKLLAKKVTKWTGVIYTQQPTMLDIYDSEDDIKHYYTISPALCPPIKLELELPL
jgi:hypothetical protein